MNSKDESRERVHRIQRAMQEHIACRLSIALKRLEGKDDSQTRQKREELLARYQVSVVLEKGARGAKQITLASHIAKGVHPDLHVGKTTNLAVDFRDLAGLDAVGSHVLAGCEAQHDTTGNGSYNAAAYELYLLLEADVEGLKLIELLLRADEDAIDAVNQCAGSDVAVDACLELVRPKCPDLAAHTMSKQLYWLTGVDACIDGGYKLLVPLYATSLAHAVYAEVQEARFGEVNKAARAAKRERRAHDKACVDYPDLAVQNMGGTKPQNISQLNSERRGMNYLLSSLPPHWKASAVRLPVNATSVFDRLFIARPDVRRAVKALRHFLESDPEPNLATRQHRGTLTDVLIDELVSLAAELHRVMPPGWSRDDERFERLDMHEKLWLDPLRAELPEESDFAKQWLAMDWPKEIGNAFARWLNNQLRGKLPVGDVEAREWRKELITDEDGFKQQLRTLRNRLGTAVVEVAT